MAATRGPAPIMSSPSLHHATHPFSLGTVSWLAWELLQRAEGAKKNTSKVEGNILCKISYVAISRRLRSHARDYNWALSLYHYGLCVLYIPFLDCPLRILYTCRTTTLTNVDMHTRIWKSSNRKGTLISHLIAPPRAWSNIKSYRPIVWPYLTYTLSLQRP